MLKIIKHCHDHSLGADDLVQGVLLGLVEDTKLEVTHCFPFPRHNDDEEFDAGKLCHKTIKKNLPSSGVTTHTTHTGYI